MLMIRSTSFSFKYSERVLTDGLIHRNFGSGMKRFARTHSESLILRLLLEVLLMGFTPDVPSFFPTIFRKRVYGSIIGAFRMVVCGGMSFSNVLSTNVISGFSGV